MASKQKHFTTRQSILLKISDTKERQKSQFAEAEQSDTKADDLYALLKTLEEASKDYFYTLKNAQFARQKAINLRKKAQRHDKTLERLKRTLAAFDTEPMEFMPNRDVVMQ